MWLELIEKLLFETKLIYINADIPLAVFMIKLLKPYINFNDFEHFQTFINYLESNKSIELRYFIQYTIRVVIDQHKENNHSRSFPTEYFITNTSKRVLNLILGTTMLSNKWAGVK